MSPEGLEGAEAPRLVTELPGPKAREVLERDGRTTSPSLPRVYPFVPARGAGSVVEDVDGNVFLDVNAGIAVTSTGHCHPTVVEAIQRQATELIHYSASDFYLPIYSELDGASGGGRADVRRRPVLPHQLGHRGRRGGDQARPVVHGPPVRDRVLRLLPRTFLRERVAHGVEGEAIGRASGRSCPGVIHAYYGDGRDMPVPPGGDEEGFPTLDHIEGFLMKKIVAPEEVAAIVVEPVLGEGGYIVPPEGWLRALRDLCDRHGILLIADEVQSGMGRTGKMWAVEHFGVEPDILLSGKGIASGMPLGAMIAKDSVMTWTTGTHGSTYGGNPLSCAAAIATLDVIQQEELLENAAKVGELLMNGLRDVQSRHDAIREVRGLGLMIGIELPDHETAAAVERAAFERGLLMLGCGEASIRMSPGPRVPRGSGARRPRALRRGRRRDRGLSETPWRSASTRHVRLRRP